MEYENIQSQTSRVLVAEDSPLGQLNLSDRQLAALRTNGHVKAVRRGRSGVTYVLCFRVDGKQVSRFLGKDDRKALAIENELHRLRAPRRFEQASEASLKWSRQLARACKHLLAPELASRGAYFHGYRLRRRRRASAADDA